MKNDPNSPDWGTMFQKKDLIKFEPANESQAMLKDVLLRWFDEKHPAPTEPCARFINAFAPEACPWCGSAGFKKDGKRKTGVQRFRCSDCHRTFSPTTGTLLDSWKIPPSEMVEFIGELFQYFSVNGSARFNRNSRSTGTYWLMKVFAAIDGIQDGTELSGRVYVDETYVRVDREGRLHPGGSLLRGLSQNQICIATARDGERGLFLVEGVGKPSRRGILAALGKHIRNGSSIVHDGENAHSALVEAAGGREEVHKASETKWLPDDENPMDPINDAHSKLKLFLRSHEPFSRGMLKDYLNLFSVIFNPPVEVILKVDLVLNRLIKTRKIMRYRDVFLKSGDDD